MRYLKDNFELFEENGDWALYLNRPVYREVTAYGNFYIINTETGENMGQLVQLHCILFDKNGNKLEEPIYEDLKYVRKEIINE